LTDEHQLVEDRMFSTLATTTRSLTGTRRRILLTDTIGFVDGVPFWLVEAFHATLEEILQADLVLLLVDATDSELEIRRKVRLAARTLFPNVPSDSVIPVLTKADELAPEEVAARAHVLADSEFHRTPLAISVRTGRGLPELRDLVHQAFVYPLEIHLVLVPGAEASAHIPWLYEHTDVVSAVPGPERSVLADRKVDRLQPVRSLQRSEVLGEGEDHAEDPEGEEQGAELVAELAENTHGGRGQRGESG